MHRCYSHQTLNTASVSADDMPVFSLVLLVIFLSCHWLWWHASLSVGGCRGSLREAIMNHPNLLTQIQSPLLSVLMSYLHSYWSVIIPSLFLIGRVLRLLERNHYMNDLSTP